MAVSVYSVRFLDHYGGPVSLLWTVPAGKRAVIRAVSWASYNSPNSMVWVAVRGKYVFLKRLTGDTDGGSLECRFVAYAGEKVTLETSGVLVGAHLSGFLFDDFGGGPAALEFEGAVQAPAGPDAISIGEE